MLSVKLNTNAEFLRSELADVVRLFLGDVPISQSVGELTITHSHREEGGLWTERAANGEKAYVHSCPVTADELEKKRRIKRAAKTAVFELLRDLYGFCPPWGSLTGIRPTRLIYERLEAGQSLGEAQKALTEEFYVSAEKASLLGEIVTMQKGLLIPEKDSFDLYIHIPFCVSRCAYCSFATQAVDKRSPTEEYTRAVIKELSDSAELIKQLGLKLRAGYVGGGTPTAIKCDQLERILDKAMTLFPGAREWTVEAGRPDTIDRERLSMLKRTGIDRICVNPQTFSDKTLALIGRAHSAEDTVRAFELAREMGFHHINMDLIAALPGEGMDEFRTTLSRTAALSPDSVTVHTLAIKRASRLHEQLTVAGDSHNQSGIEVAEKMVSYAREHLSQAGYRPYYLYRQKYMAGNLENVGYAKPGYACLYNIGNMEETQRVLAVGAGAITKWVFDRERRIERAPNLRNIEQYIERVDEMTLRKLKVLFGSPANRATEESFEEM